LPWGSLHYEHDYIFYNLFCVKPSKERMTPISDDRSGFSIESPGRVKKLAGAALIVILATALSRVFGYGREIAAAAYFGAGAEKSAFDVAFMVPSTIQTLVAQAALSAALIPVFAGLLEKDRRDEAWLVARTVFTVLIAVLGIFVAACIVFAPQIMPLFAPGYRNDPAIMSDIVRMSRLLFPTVVLLAMSGVVVSILNSFEHFTLPAIAPVFWNLVILLAIFFGSDRLGIDALAWGVLLGTLVQLAIQLPALKGKGARLGFSLSLRNPHVKRVGALMLPVSISLGLINLNGIVDMQFASFLGEGGVAAINYAFRIYQLPEALFAIAVGTVLFPTLSRLAARDDKRNFRSALTTGVQLIFFMLIPISAFMLALSEPIIRLAYEHGRFEASDTTVVASALFFFAFGSAFSGGSALLTRGFFSLSRPWVPTSLALINLAMNAFLNWLFIKFFGLGGIPLSTSVVSIATFMALLLLMRRQLKRVNGKALLRSGITVGVTSVVAAGAAYLSWRFLDGLLGLTLAAQMLSLTLAAMEAAGIFLLVAWLTGMPELKLLANLRHRQPASA
jgi:putative peptidoglycan lipid II flippase